VSTGGSWQELRFSRSGHTFLDAHTESCVACFLDLKMLTQRAAAETVCVCAPLFSRENVTSLDIFVFL